MTLRAGVGWAVLSASRGGMGEYAVLDTAAPWTDEGMGECGWLFEAAGLTLAEGRAVVASGALTLAVLRGAPRPQGVSRVLSQYAV